MGNVNLLGRGAHAQSRYLHGLKVVMWVTLKMLSFECKPLEEKKLHTPKRFWVQTLIVTREETFGFML